MPSLRIYELFIAHAWTYNAEYYRLVGMLDNAPYFSWRNHSVPEHDQLPGGSRLGEQLRNQLRPVNAVLILAGMYVNHREWMLHELDMAIELRKPVIGIYPWGQQRSPIQVTKAARVMAGWNTSSIVTAIRQHSL